MPIRIRETVEPFSRSTTSFGTGPGAIILIESDAYRLLTQEARRYVLGEVRGRSFLIAGHRGSGKTTLVLHVCQELRDFSPHPARRVLPVFLHGPNLLPDLSRAIGGEKPPADPSPASPPAEGGTPPAAAGKADRPPPGALSKDETENALIQITLELYRSLALEVTSRFREAVYAGPVRAGVRVDPALAELAAQLEVELDRCPEPARLRQIWAQAGLLEDGVLFAPGPAVAAERPDQGLRELVALSSACEMYRRISGSFTSEQERKDEAKREAEASVAASSQGKDFFSPLTVLLTGGLVGTGALATGTTSGPIAALTGVIAALGAATVFKVSASRSRRRTVTEDSKFVRDLTVKTLDREIPVLVERCLDAGLVPFFIIDELDKVEGLSSRITSLVKRLKKLVAERAFFCFLSDRSYFEEMRERMRARPYSIEYTYFTYDLFVVFDHRDLHRFLLRILTLAEPSNRRRTASGTGDGGPTPPASSVSIVSSDEVEDLRILPYVLLHQAKMHPIDLRRELTRLGDQNRAPGEWRSRANLCDLMIQVAVEVVLEGEAMQERLRREPRFRRLAHDALYYPSRRWEDGEYDLDLGDEQEEDFGEWLISRMGREGDGRRDKAEAARAEAPKTKEGAKAAKEKEAAEPPPELLSREDRRFLFERVRELARLLSDKTAFQTAFLTWEARPEATSVPEDRRLTWAAAESHARLVLPLLEEDGPDHAYLWRLDYAGLELRPGAAPATRGVALGVEALEDPFAAVDRLREFAKALAAIPGEPKTRPDGTPWLNLTLLASELRILGISPSWAETERAMDRLDSLRSGGKTPAVADLDPQGAQDLGTVGDFHTVLTLQSRTLALALLYGAVLGQAARAETCGERLVAGLRAISRMYRFEARLEEEKAKALSSLAGLLAEADPPTALETPRAPESLSPEAWTTWGGTVREAGASFEPTADWRERQVRAAWEVWGSRIEGVLGGTESRSDPSAAELWCAAAGELPASLLAPDLEAMKLRDWSRLVHAAVAGPPEASRAYLPFAALMALGRLGFESDQPKRLLKTLQVLAAGPEARKGAPEIEPERGWGRALDFLARRTAPTRKALVVCRDQGSLTEGWAAPRSGGLLALTRKELWQDAFLESVGKAPPLLASLGLDLIAVELAPADGAEPRGPATKGKRRGELKATLGSLLTFNQPEQIAERLAQWGPPPAVVYLAADSSVRVPMDHPAIYAPSDADDLLSKAPPPPRTAS